MVVENGGQGRENRWSAPAILASAVMQTNADVMTMSVRI